MYIIVYTCTYTCTHGDWEPIPSRKAVQHDIHVHVHCTLYVTFTAYKYMYMDMYCTCTCTYVFTLHLSINPYFSLLISPLPPSLPLLLSLLSSSLPRPSLSPSLPPFLPSSLPFSLPPSLSPLQGCEDALTDFIQNNLLIVATVAITFVVAEVCTLDNIVNTANSLYSEFRGTSRNITCIMRFIIAGVLMYRC